MNKFTLNAHEQKQVYWHINTKGKVYLKIHSASGSGKAKVWWTTGPFGRNVDVGLLTGVTVLEIRGLFWGRLKAQAVNEALVAQVHDDPQVNIMFPPIKIHW